MESSEKPPFNLPQPRSEVEEMKPYKAPLEGRRNHLRLDFNENTIGPSPLVLEALKNIDSNEISIYPEYNGLQNAVKNNLNNTGIKHPLNPDQIGIFNGVDAAINAIFHAYAQRDDQLLTTTPTFGYYTPCAQMQGMRIVALPYEGKNFQFPLNKIREALKMGKPKLLLLCNPNNPTGSVISADVILKLSEDNPNTLVVVDELYESFDGDSVLPKINFNSTPNLVILRSLSKTAGLAGLRIGFTIGNSRVIDYIKRVTGPYDINSFAVKAAFAALKDQAYIDDYKAEVLRARDWIKDELISNRVEHHIAGGNYFLIWPKRESDEIEACLKNDGILVRNMRGKPLIEKSLRVSIGTQTQMQQFWDSYMKHECK